MTLRALVEDSGDADLPREMIGFAAERLMKLEVSGLTGPAPGETSAVRPIQHDGYRDLDRQMPAGSVVVDYRTREAPSLTPGANVRAWQVTEALDTSVRLRYRPKCL